MSQKKFTIDKDTIQVQSGTSQAGKDYQITKFKVVDADGNEFDGDVYGDKQVQVREAAAGTVVARLVEDVFKERDNTDIVCAPSEYKGKTTWKFKFPFVKSGVGGSGGSKWQGKGGYSSGSGGGNRYQGKALDFNAYMKFCGDVLTASAGQVGKLFNGLSPFEHAEISQKLASTYLIGIQQGLAYPDGCAPSVTAAQPASQDVGQSAGSGAPKAVAPEVDMGIPQVKAYMMQITIADSSETLDVIDSEVVADKSLEAMQRIALRQKIVAQRRALDL